MKPIVILALLLCLSSTVVFGQIKIGDNPQNIDASSVLELESTDRVLVITRVNNLTMESITPLRGAVLYNTDTQCLHYFNGTEWINLCDAVSFSLTNDPIVNTRSTISITDNGGTINLEVAPNSIRSENIVDGGINGDDIQDNSIGESKLGADSVSANELRDNSVGTTEVIDGSITAADIANSGPNQILTTDDTGAVNWVDANTVSGVATDGTTITGTGVAGDVLSVSDAVRNAISVNSQDIAEHIGSDMDTDARNELTDLFYDPATNILSLTRSEVGTTIDLGGLNNPGTDNQTLDLTGNTLSISGGNNVDLQGYLDNTDAQELEINGNVISISGGNDITLPAGAVDTDEQDLTLAGTTLNITNGIGVDLNPILLAAANGDETILNEGTNITISGVGTLDDPYVINAADGALVDGSETIIDAISSTIAVTGTGTTLDPYVLTATAGDGSETIIDAATSTVAVTGTGTAIDPYILTTTAGDGSETIIDATASTVAVTGTGTTLDPYVLTATAGDGSETIIDAIASTVAVTGTGTTLDPYVLTATAGDGSETIIDAIASTVAVTGTGTMLDPYVLTSTAGDGSETIIDAAASTVAVTGTGTTIDPYVLTATAGDGSETIIDAAASTVAVTGTGTTLDPYVLTATAGDGSETIIDAAASTVAVTGTGTTIDPYILTATAGDGSETIIDAAASTVAVTGTGTTIDPYILTATAGENLENTNLTQTNEDRTYSFGPNALTFIGTGTVGISQNPLFDAQAALHVDGTILGNFGFATDAPLGFYFNGDIDTGLNFDEFTPDLVSLTAGNVRALTATNNGATTNVLIPESLELDGVLLDNLDVPGTAGQVLTTTGTGVEWQTVAGAGTIVSANAPNAITVGTDGGALYDNTAILATTAANALAINAKEDAENKSNDGTLFDNSPDDFPTEQAVKTYVDTQIGTVAAGNNLSNADLTLNADRTHDLAGFDLILEGTGNIGLGNFNGPGLPAGPADKLDVNGQIRTRGGFAANPGTAGEPSYGFYTDGDANTGMFRSGPDEIGFSVGGFEALRIDEPTDGNTNVIVNQSLELDGVLTDINGTNGINGQILSSTGAGVEWINAPIGGGGLTTDTTLDGDGQAGTPLTIADNSINSARIIDASVSADDLADDSVNTVEIVDAAVTSEKIAPGAEGEVLTTVGGATAWAIPTAGTIISDASLEGDGQTGSPLTIADNSINSARIVDASVSAEDLADDSVNTAEIVDAAVTSEKIAPGAEGEVLTTVGGATAWAIPTAGTIISDASLDGDGQTGSPLTIADNSINSARIVDASVSAADLADDSVNTAEIVDAAVTSEKIAPGAEGEVLTTVGGATAWAIPTAGTIISDASLDGDGQTGSPLTIADNSINSARIVDASVSAADLAINSVETGEILNETIINEDISPVAAIEGSKINPVFTADIVTTGNISGVDIAASGTINAAGNINGNIFNAAGIINAGAGINSTGAINLNGIALIPDYVFQKYFTGTSTLNENYTFKSLQEIEAFVTQHQHLPGVQSASEIKKQGYWNLGEASRINLEKIEELFLHTIEQEKKINQLKQANETMASEVQLLKAQMEEIKKMLSAKTKD